jgi:RNA polymerase sigma-70 factor, ECF subfamily
MGSPISSGKLSQTEVFGRCYGVNASSEGAVESASEGIPFDIESVFREKFVRISRVIARVVRDSARAEELAVEAFVKLWRTPQAHGDHAEAWLYRTAVRLSLDELRRQHRRTRFERLVTFVRPAPTPEELHATAEEQDRVRLVLGGLPGRQAELLLLRNHDLSYTELAAALDLNPASLGTLLSRAQQSFRKEYIKRYGEQQRG